MKRDRFWPALTVALYLIFLQILSLSPLVGSGPCLIKTTHDEQSAHDYQEKDCPALFSGSLILLRRLDLLIGQHDKSIVAEFTIVLAISTIGLWLATQRLWEVTNRAEKTRDRDTRILQRAYLSAEPRGLHETTNGDVIAHVAFVNGGNLPARKVRNAVEITLSDNGEKSDFESVEVEPGQVLITSKGTIERGTGPLDQEGAMAYRDRLDGFYIYVWGRIEYEDGFGSPQWLIFCHRYNCANPDISRVHHHHNDGD